MRKIFFNFLAYLFLFSGILQPGFGEEFSGDIVKEMFESELKRDSVKAEPGTSAREESINDTLENHSDAPGKSELKKPASFIPEAKPEKNRVVSETGKGIDSSQILEKKSKPQLPKTTIKFSDSSGIEQRMDAMLPKGISSTDSSINPEISDTLQRKPSISQGEQPEMKKPLPETVKEKRIDKLLDSSRNTQNRGFTKGPDLKTGSKSVDSILSQKSKTVDKESLLSPDSSIRESLMYAAQVKNDPEMTKAPEALLQFIGKESLLQAAPIKVITTSKILSSLVLLLAGWIFLRYMASFLNLLSERWYRHRLTIKGIIPVFRIVGWTVIFYIIVVVIFRPPIQSVLALTASAGIAIGIASQDILKNIFGGVMILLDKPFKVGDKIQIENHYGEVIGIGLRTVRLVTTDDSVISVPNSEIVNKSVSNSNAGAADCQVVAEFFFPQNLDLDKAHELALKCATLSKYVYLKKPIAVVFNNEFDKGLNVIKMRLKAYVFDHRYEFAFSTDMSKIVLREFTRAGLILSDASTKGYTNR